MAPVAGSPSARSTGRCRENRVHSVLALRPNRQPSLPVMLAAVTADKSSDRAADKTAVDAQWFSVVEQQSVHGTSGSPERAAHYWRALMVPALYASQFQFFQTQSNVFRMVSCINSWAGHEPCANHRGMVPVPARVRGVGIRRRFGKRCLPSRTGGRARSFNTASHFFTAWQAKARTTPCQLPGPSANTSARTSD